MKGGKGIALLTWLVFFLLGTTLAQAQEIYLDGVKKCGELYCYPALDDPHTFYYVPANPRLAQKNGRPEFSFLKYARLKEAQKAGTGETEGGGLLHFLVTYGVDKETLKEAEQDLQAKVPGAKIAGPVAFQRGTFALVTAFQKENARWVKTVALGKAPLMEGQKTAVSLALTKEGAEILWEDFKTATPDISLVFEMEFAGYRKPYEAEVIVDWAKVFQNHRVQAGMRYAWFGADIDLLFQELRRTGAIKIVIKGGDAASDKLVASVQQKLLDIMFEPIDAQNLMQQAIKEDSYSNLNKALDFLTKVKKIDQSRLQSPPLWARDFWQALFNWCPNAWAGDLGELNKVFSALFKALDTCVGNISQKIINFHKELLKEQKSADKQPGKAAKPKAADLELDPIVYLPQYVTLCAKMEGVCLQVVENENLSRACSLLEPTCNAWVERDKKRIRRDVKSCYQKFKRCLKGHALETCETGLNHCLAQKKERWIAQTQRLQNRFLRRIECVNTPSQYCQKRFARCMEKTEKKSRCLKSLLACSCGIGKSKKKKTQPTATKPPSQDKPTQTKPQKTSETAREKGTPETHKPQGEKAPQKPGSGTKVASKEKDQAQSKDKPEKKDQAQKKDQGKSEQKKVSKRKKGPGFSLVAAYRMRRIKQSGYFYYSLKRYRVEKEHFIMTFNIGDLYHRYGQDRRIFRQVLIDDPVFKQRNILVTIDGQDARTFAAHVNAVTVQLRKRHQFGDLSTDEVVITPELFNAQGNAFFLRYGWKEDHSREAWLRYEYRVIWDFKGGVRVDQGWQQASSAVLNVVSPFKYLPVTIEGDKGRLEARGVRHAVVTFISRLGDQEIHTQVTLKNSGLATSTIVDVPVPRQGEQPEVLISWHLRGGQEISQGPFPLKGSLIYWDELPE